MLNFIMWILNVLSTYLQGINRTLYFKIFIFKLNSDLNLKAVIPESQEVIIVEVRTALLTLNLICE